MVAVMYPTAAVQSYRNTQAKSASKIDLLLMAYDVAIRAANNGDTVLFTRVMAELKSSLDPTHGPESVKLAGRLLAIYIYCEDLVRKQNGEEAAKLLGELRETWAVAARSTGPGR